MIKLWITDDDPFIRESLKLLMAMDPDIEVAGTSGSGEEALEAVREGSLPDVMLMDIRMPGCGGVEATKSLKRLAPSVQILVLTTFDDDDFIIEALKNGASGYLLKNIPPDRIIQGIKTVKDGNMLIHPDIARKLTGFIHAAPVSPASASPGPVLSAHGLTQTEQTIVAKIADGLSNKEIAQELFLSEGTIKNYISEILGKLALRDRTQIAIFYWKEARS
ncbi:response regulator transcription factor [Paenibacillus sp. UNC499MF]|uniref:response regulator transcription factor n=1 Tax=Paenibacillus sp. UNC499MF TaxID=1502751 RepID=UPI00089FC092|nr:response regulator transcription factor [Paenibacillus sp. UNC499MF]SEF53453.1 DNA-binding response regulator, NarL/FixJ family, contains REC and HTH domains [Paenibacillus sp. UNC499MF]